MKYIRLDKGSVSRKDFELAKEYLSSNKIVLMPSDTVYGLSVRADQAKAVRKLRRFKGRPDKKPLLILASDLKMIKKYFSISRDQENYLNKVWSPKSSPTTVILPDKKLLPKELNESEDGLAVRLPKNDFLIKMIKSLGVPLVSTSANLNGLEPISDPSDISASLGQKKPQLIIDGGKCGKTRASRLIDLRLYPKIKILRK